MTFAYNTARRTATAYSSNPLLYAREPFTALDADLAYIDALALTLKMFLIEPNKHGRQISMGKPPIMTGMGYLFGRLLVSREVKNL